MSEISTISPPYRDLQARLRSLSCAYAKTQTWCRRPQNQNEKLTAVFKPRINILIRPPFVKTGVPRQLEVGSGEILFHIFGKFDDIGFVADPAYRILCGPRSPIGLKEMIDCKLDRYEPVISSGLHAGSLYIPVRYLYTSVYESLVCMHID